MGDEYRIHVELPESDAGDALIAKALDGIGRRTPQGWEFRADWASTDEMPDAAASAEVGGLYVVLYGGLRGFGAAVLGALVVEAIAVARGDVRVEEL